jgi:hypothetical protein
MASPSIAAPAACHQPRNLLEMPGRVSRATCAGAGGRAAAPTAWRMFDDYWGAQLKTKFGTYHPGAAGRVGHELYLYRSAAATTCSSATWGGDDHTRAETSSFRRLPVLLPARRRRRVFVRGRAPTNTSRTQAAKKNSQEPPAASGLDQHAALGNAVRHASTSCRTVAGIHAGRGAEQRG